MEDIRKENQQQKEDLLQTIRENDTQIKLMNVMLDNFIPEEERVKIEEHCSWDEESHDWTVAHQNLTGLSCAPLHSRTHTKGKRERDIYTENYTPTHADARTVVYRVKDLSF